MVCSKPSVHHNLTKQINKIFSNAQVTHKTHELTVRVLKENVLYKRDIDEKLILVIKRLIRSERQKIVILFSDLIRSQASQEAAT